MDKELERIMNMSEEERIKVNRRIDGKRIDDPKKNRRGHIKECRITIPKRDSESERLEKERIRYCVEMGLRKGRAFKIYGGA